MRKNIIVYLFVILFLSCTDNADTKFIISDITAIYLDDKSDQLIKWAVSDFASDLEKIQTATRPGEFTSANDNELERRIKIYRELYNKTEEIKPCSGSSG